VQVVRAHFPPRCLPCRARWSASRGVRRSLVGVLEPDVRPAGFGNPASAPARDFV